MTAFAFDTLAYTKRLEAAGVEREHAEAHAQAAPEFIMRELVTKSDLVDALDRQSLRLTIRLGTLMAAGIGALAVLLKLT